VPGHFAQSGPVLARPVHAGPLLRMLCGLGLSVLLHVVRRCWGIFQNLCSCILYRAHRLDLLYRLDVCPCIFLGRPSLELAQQGSNW